MMERLGVGDAWSKLPRPVRRGLLPAVVALLLVLYPSYYGDLT